MERPPSGLVVVETCPSSTRMEVSTRPDAERASTVHGNGGRPALSITGAGPPAFDTATCIPLTKTPTSSFVPLEIPSAGRAGEKNAARGRSADEDQARRDSDNAAMHALEAPQSA